MKVFRRILFVPVYFIAVIINVIAGFLKQVFSLASGIFFLVMIACMVVTVFNHTWNQTMILAVLMVAGYVILTAVVAMKVLIEEFKDFCFSRML